jgi:CRISPR-associated protein Cas1
VLEGEVRRAINMVGLEPSIGWLHEFTGSQTRESAVYDLMEAFRWLADVTTIQAFESGVLDLKDFYFTGDDYSYKIEIEAKRRFLQLLEERFNSGVRYKRKNWNWDTVILTKTQELARCLPHRSESIDYVEPGPGFREMDTRTFRERIIKLSVTEARRLGIGKSTLWNLQKRSRSRKPLQIYTKTVDRIGR